MKEENNASIISRTINELGYENLEAVIKIAVKSPSTMHLVIEKIMSAKVDNILLVDSQTTLEQANKRLEELSHKQFHIPSFLNGWNECLGILRENHINKK